MKRLSLAAIMFLLTQVIAGHLTFATDLRWQTPFDTTSSVRLDGRDTVFTLTQVLSRVASQNPSLRSFNFRNDAAQAELKQARLWPNPELEAEFDGVGWDAPGFKESEMTVSLSQELELFGRRSAREKLARAGSDAAKLATRISAFDLYVEVKERFFTLIHAQRQFILADSSVILAESIVQNIAYRMEKGAALQSELLLAQLELQRVQLTREESRQNLNAAQARLSVLWGNQPRQVYATANEEPELHLVRQKLAAMSGQVDSSRDIMYIQSAADIARAEQQLAGAEARPNVRLIGGYKRLAAEGSNALMFGLSLPLPLFNRNQGAIAGTDARLRALEFEQQRTRLEVQAGINIGTTRLTQLTERHAALDSLLLPTAVQAYAKLHHTYEEGRVPYTSLLEAERALIELRFEHNDMLLAICEQIFALERLTGAIIFSAND